MGYFETVVVYACAAIILAVSLDLLIGVAGLFSAAAGVFYGIGAYAAGLVWLHLTSDFVLAVIVAAAAGAIIAVPFVVPALRSTSEVTFVVASLAFAAVIGAIFTNWQSVTGGDAGLNGIPIPTIGPLQLEPGGAVVVAGVILAALVVVIKEFLAGSEWGLELRALKDDVAAASAAGVRGTRRRVEAAVIASAMAAVAGVIYAAQVGYVNPSGFGLTQSQLVAAMVVLGGLATLAGPIVGAIALTAIPAALTFAPISPDILGISEQLVYGLILTVVIMARPAGLVGAWTRVSTRRTRSITSRVRSRANDALLESGISEPVANVSSPVAELTER